jgi:hypothetical protein
MVSRETKRQLIHISGASIPLFVLWLGQEAVLTLVGAAVLIGLGVAWGYRRGIRDTIFSWPIEVLERPGVIETRPASASP